MSASATRSRSKERALELAAHFRIVFDELRTAVNRPFATGLSGIFDPIELPVDVTALHDALAADPDSVSPVELDRCVKIVTEMSSKRKMDMFAEISAAMAAERDAQLAAMLAERDV